jgi:heme oxygenase
MNSGLHAHLKKGITPWHAKVDQHPVLQALIQNNLDLAGYTRALACLAPAQWAMEACVDSWGRAHPALPFFHPRGPALQTDLQRLGALPCPAVPDFGTLSKTLRTLCRDNLFAQFGLLYTLLGANQGARFLLASVTKQLGPEVPIRYLSQLNNPNGTWADFLAWGNTADPHNPEHGIALETAIIGFKMVLLQLDAHTDWEGQLPRR